MKLAGLVSNCLLRAPVDKNDEQDGGQKDRSDGEPLKPHPNGRIGLKRDRFLKNRCGQNHGEKRNRLGNPEGVPVGRLRFKNFLKLQYWRDPTIASGSTSHC